MTDEAALTAADAVHTKAAVLWPDATEWSVEDVTLDPPQHDEVLVRLVATGLCHSDDHLRHGGYPGIRLPMIGGHEGAGIVEAIGPDVRNLAIGDHVLLTVPVPPCGDCPSCLDGLTYLCERGALLGEGFQVSDGTARHHARGTDLGIFVLLGTFAQHTVVAEKSCVRVDPALDLEQACIIGCAGVTGWGAVLNTAAVRAGDVVVVAGSGGIGSNAIQAARFAGARDVIAVDPVPFKRQIAAATGATLTVADLDEALIAVRDLTHGRMANSAVLAMAHGDGRLLESALSLVGKRGRVVIVNAHPATETSATVSLRTLQSLEKQVVGCLAGSWDARKGIRLLTELHQAGHYDLEPLVTHYDSLDDLAKGYDDLAAGTVVRGVIRLNGGPR